MNEFLTDEKKYVVIKCSILGNGNKIAILLLLLLFFLFSSGDVQNPVSFVYFISGMYKSSKWQVCSLLLNFIYRLMQ